MKPQEAVREFQKDYDETVKRLKAEVQKQIDAGVPPDQAVTKAIKETGMIPALTKGVEKAISDAYESPALSISKHGGNPFDHWQAGDMKLSEVIHGAGIQIKQTIAAAIKHAQKEGSAIQKTARLLYDGYGYGHVTKRQKLPEYLEQLLNDVDEAVNGADVAKDEAMKAVIKDVKKAARNVSRLSGMTSGSMNLKTAYKALLKASAMFNDKLVENTARTAIEEKSRYIADRIARTEAARAYAQSTFDKYANDKDIVAYKWTLSSRHPCDDICDLYANADLYGMGKGVFPKDKFPMLPVHPNCLCHMTPMHRAELDNLTPVKDPLKAGEEYLKTARPNVLKRILGVNGAADFKAGRVKWWDVAREYKTEYMKEFPFLETETKEYYGPLILGIANGTISLAINKQKQNRHILGTKEYREDKSVLYVSIEEAQDLVDRYHGTGEMMYNKKGEWENTETVKTNKIVGYLTDWATNQKIGTKTVTIHYSRTGTHIVPKWETQK